MSSSNSVLLLFCVLLTAVGCLAHPKTTYEDKTSACWVQRKGVCVSEKDPCPFVNGTSFESDSNTHLCPDDDRRCCVAPARSDVYKRQGRCGISYYRRNYRIHGGIRAMPREFPWQVSLQYTKRKHCGATILTPEWLLTAAHCTYFYEHKLEYWSIVAGTTNLAVPTREEQRRNVSRIVEHPQFHNPEYVHDIALIKVSPPLKMTRYVNTACLPERDENFQNMICQVSGFGNTENTTSGSDILLETSKPVVESEMCAKNYCKSRKPVYTTNICGGFKSGERDACQGDSGGPFVCQKKDNHNINRYILAGVVSHGDGCARAGRPGIYTRVEDYLDWIAHHIAEKSEPAPEVPFKLAGHC